MGKTMGS